MLSNSVVKVTYAESLRVYGNGKWCRWSIRVDNKDCNPAVFNAKHTTATSDNDHTPHAIVGACKGLSKGNHRMTIGLTRSGGADCYTGWSASGARDAFFMEAEELNPQGLIAVAMRQVGADGRENGWANNRLLNFNKKSSGSQLRLTWASNLRVRAGNNRGGAWCNWELRIDGKSCSQPSKIGVSMHSQQNDNDHIPVEVVGWCRNIGKGNHKRQLRLLHRLERARLHGGVGTHCGGDGYDVIHAESWHGHRERRFQQYPVSQLQKEDFDSAFAYPVLQQPAGYRSWQVVSLGSEGRRQVVLRAFGGIRLHPQSR